MQAAITTLMLVAVLALLLGFGAVVKRDDQARAERAAQAAYTTQMMAHAFATLRAAK